MTRELTICIKLGIACLMTIYAAWYSARQASADQLSMKDGRFIEGEIIKEAKDTLTIDAMISDVRATLTFPRLDIAHVLREPVPRDFFERKMVKPDERESDRAAFDAQDTLYLTIPVKGRIGVDLEAKSLSRIFSYARRYRIKHLVFMVNSDKQGNVDEAKRITNLLIKHQDEFIFHALVKKCLGDALAVVVPCQHMILLPGAKIGGLDTALPAAKDHTGKMTNELVLRQQLALDFEDHMNSQQRPGIVARAMMDPYADLVGWINEEGMGEFDTELSGAINEESIVIQAIAGEPLVMTAAQAYKLGAPKFKGSAQEYGDDFHEYWNWKKESDYPKKIIEENAKKAYKREAVLIEQFDNKVARNLDRRKQTRRNLEYHLKRAKAWDPKKVKLTTKTYHGWGWSGRRWRRDYPRRYRVKTNDLTDQSRINLARHTDAALTHLAHAIRAIGAMRQLDIEAEKLGLQTSYKKGQLEKMYKQLLPQIEAMKANRNKRKK